MGQQAIQPGALDQFGGRHRAQEIQGMGTVAEVLAGTPGNPVGPLLNCYACKL